MTKKINENKLATALRRNAKRRKQTNKLSSRESKTADFEKNSQKPEITK